MTIPVVKNLFVLVADLDMENALHALLTRSTSLGIHDITFDIERHPGRDAGCRAHAVEHLRPFLGSYDRALVVFDRYGSGSDDPRDCIGKALDGKLRANGWPDQRAKVIVIEPELEAWLWAGSPVLSQALGWGSAYGDLRRWLVSRGLWSPDSPKPEDPKKAMRAAMRHRRTPWSSRLFAGLGQSMSFSRCRDPAFTELRDTLRAWFPPTPTRPTPEASTDRN